MGIYIELILEKTLGIFFFKLGWYVIVILCLENLPNISEQLKDGLLDAFAESTAFEVMEHNALLNALANPKEGWNLHEWDEKYYFTISDLFRKTKYKCVCSIIGKSEIDDEVFFKNI
jgi:hypothetical protein